MLRPCHGRTQGCAAVTSEELLGGDGDDHRRIDADRWEDIYVVGDVHGCLPALQRLVERIGPDEETLLVVVGDLVRKGPDSRGVVEFVRERDTVISVRGNNEDKLIRGDKHLPELSEADMAYVESLPHAISWEDNLVVHGGIDPRKALADHDSAELLTMRSLAPGGSYDRPYWFEEYDGRPRVFFGHTVLAEPFESPSAVGLDTGCVYGGALTAYHVDTGEFVTVEPTETYQERSADSIVTPRASG
ncbi:metallophosphoesterase family protein [Halosimplex aquaticum]|uniref:Metallophosphoesterase family protein n=1 Tax=Halosimplex aquaticum TaxID=3026162 RepID=A0ABD5Y5Y4_9EURY|nr:metallophosphoesterase family protein [Halosimplex aquaticum]